MRKIYDTYQPCNTPAFRRKNLLYDFVYQITSSMHEDVCDKGYIPIIRCNVILFRGNV